LTLLPWERTGIPAANQQLIHEGNQLDPNIALDKSEYSVELKIKDNENPLISTEPFRYIILDPLEVLFKLRYLISSEQLHIPAFAKLAVQPLDLTISRPYDYDTVIALPNGRQLIEDLNELINLYDYRLVFYSAYPKETQLNRYEQIKKLCEQNGLACPPLHAMAVLDENYSQYDQNNPLIENDDGVYIATFGDVKYRESIKNDPSSTVDYRDLTCSAFDAEVLRRALQAMFKVLENNESRSQHIIFDSKPHVIDTSTGDGYRAVLINNKKSLAEALSDEKILAHSRKAGNLVQAAPLQAELSNNPALFSLAFFQKTLVQVKENPLSAMQYKDLPFDFKCFLIHKAEDLSRRLGGEPLTEEEYWEYSAGFEEKTKDHLVNEWEQSAPRLQK
jgi:hypothetical protein